MKIAHITGVPAAGGAEVYLKDLSIKMVREGHDVCVVFISHAHQYDLSVSYEKRYLQDLEDNGVKYHFLNLKNRKNLVKGAFLLRKLIQFLDVQIVHCHLYYAVLYTTLLRCKVVYTHHSIKLGVTPIFYKFILNRLVDQYIGICDSCNELIKRVSGRSSVKIYNGVSVDRLQLKKEGDRSSGCIQIVAVGRISKPKGYELMIEMIEQLKDKSPVPFQLLILGEGEESYTNHLKLLANKKNLIDDGIIQFLGCRTDVPEILSYSDIFIMTSLWEGLPIAQIEAALTGLPMVVTNVGGCHEIVDICQCGDVVPPGSLETFVSVLCHMLIDRDYRIKCGSNALRRSEVFKIEYSVAKHIELYRGLLEYEQI